MTSRMNYGGSEEAAKLRAEQRTDCSMRAERGDTTLERRSCGGERRVGPRVEFIHEEGIIRESIGCEFWETNKGLYEKRRRGDEFSQE